mgnify:CR=1 FL=1
MTISDISTLVCTKMGRTDADTLSVAKSLLKRRYQMIYDSALWAESLATVSKAVVAGSPDVTLDQDPDVYYNPSGTVVGTSAPRLEIPISVRFIATSETDGIELVPSDWWTFFQIDPNILTNDATHRARPSKFIHLPRSNASVIAARIRLVPSPNTDGTVYVLGKLKWAEPADTDTPTINGIDNTLLAMNEADMLERQRQYGKAQIKMNEAGVLLTQMREAHKNQFASDTVIVPYGASDSRTELGF